MISNLSGSYEQKLAALGLTTLEDSRERGDMIEMYKIMTGKSKMEADLFFSPAPVRSGALNTRGNSGFLNVAEPAAAKTNIRRNFFSQRCPRIWNSLPNEVKQVDSVNGFKSAYDAYKGFRRI